MMFGKNMKIFLLTLLLAVGSFSANAQTEPAIDRLAKTKRFLVGGSGAAGNLSEGEKIYREILAQRSALDDFIIVFQIGSPEAKCYALAGIKKLDPKLFEDLVTPLLTSKTEVNAGSSIMEHTTQMWRIVKRLKEDGYRFAP